MTCTYSLIVKNIIKTENNNFDVKYINDGVDLVIKINFKILLEKEINVKNKFEFFFYTINSFLIKKIDFINYFFKIQKTYNVLNRFVYNYKYNRAKIVVNTDMCLNELIPNSKNVICLFQNNSKFLFQINDIIKIIYASLTNSPFFFSEPLTIKNPYNNLPFNKSILYNIYFFIKFKTTYYSELIFKFFYVNFNLTIFKNKNEYLLSEISIYNYVYNSTSQILVYEIKNMISYFNLKYCKNQKFKIIINPDFPKNKLIKIFQPYLQFYITSQYSFLRYIKNKAENYLKYGLESFQTFNPQFGRKKIKILIKFKNNLKRKITDQIIGFDDRYIKFNDIENLNKYFLSDHLKYDDTHNLVNDENYDDDDEVDDDEVDENDIIEHVFNDDING